MAENISTLTDATFDEEVGSSELPVLVDFWAEWCGPCKQIAPILAEIAGEYDDKIRIAKINIDENPNVAMRYGVMSIPTLIVFEGTTEAARIVGAKPKNALVQELASFL